MKDRKFSSIILVKTYKKVGVKKFWQDISRHPAKHVNLKSNTIMKKPRCKYKKEIINSQTISIKN